MPDFPPVRCTVLALGSINADLQVRTDAGWGSAETVIAHDFRMGSGGKAANRALLAAAFGQDARLVGQVGDDRFATLALHAVRRFGVDTGGVGHARGPTGVAMIGVTPDGKKSIIVSPNANDRWSEADAARACAIIRGAPPPAGLSLDCEIPAWVAHRAIAAARGRGMPVFLDPSFAERVDRDMLGQCEAIIPNVEEAGTLAGHHVGSRDAAVHAGLQLRRTGVAVVCIKLPDGGCVVATRSGVWCIDGSHAAPVDTTGAGDAMSAVLTLSMLEGHDPLQAALRGVAAANLAILRYGSQPDFVSRHDVDRLARQIAPRFVTGP